MLGPGLLVASVLAAGVRTRRVYLPAGTPWCDFYSGQWHAGGQEIEAAAPLDHIPLFAPAGGIVPTGKPMRYVGEQPDDVRRVYVFPHPETGAGAFSLIEDDGVSLAYRAGGYSQLHLTVDARPDEIALRAEVLHNGYALPYRQIEFALPAGETRPIRNGGAERTDAEGRRVIVMRL